MKHKTPTLIAVGFLAIVLAGVLGYILYDAMQERSIAAKAASISDGYIAALQRAFFIDDTARASRTDMFLAEHTDFCTPEKLNLADPSDGHCRIAAQKAPDKQRPLEATCLIQTGEICAALEVDPAFYNDSALQQRAVSVLKDPCAFLLDAADLQALEARRKNGEALGSHAARDLADQRRARNDLGCDLAQKPERRVIVAHGKNVMILKFSGG